MQQLTGLDASFLHAELPRTPMHIGTLQIYDMSTAPDGFVRFKDILRVFQDRIKLSPVFRRKLVTVPLNLDHPYWGDDEDFDLEYHVRHVALPKPGDWRQLCIQCSRLMTRPLDRTRPLWEVYVIEGLDNVESLKPGCFALYMKIHHAAVDGATSSEIIQAIHDLTPTPEIGEKADSWKPQVIPSQSKLLRQAYLNNLKHPQRVLDLLRQGIPAWGRVREGRRQNRFRSLGKKERTRFNAAVSGARVYGTVSFPLPDIRSVKTTVQGATVNDVILSVVSGAMRGYLQAKHELPEKSLVAGCPVNVRVEEVGPDGGNRVSMMNISLCSDIADPVDRLKAVNQAAVESKAYHNAVSAHLLTDLNESIPSQVAALGFRSAAAAGLMSTMSPTFNTIVTNVPGPQMPLYMGGAKLVRLCATGVNMDNMGLFHPVVSYNGNVAICFQACREMMPDPEFYGQCLQEAFDDLYQAASGSQDASTKKQKTSAASKRSKKPA